MLAAIARTETVVLDREDYPSARGDLLEMTQTIAVTREVAESKPAGESRILSMVAILLKDLDAGPTPVDAVAVDQPILDLHHLDEIHLLAVRRRSRIFPHQHLAIGEETAAIATSRRRRALEHDADEFA